VVIAVQGGMVVKKQDDAQSARLPARG